MTSFRRLLARRSLIRLLIFIPLTWLLFSLMYSFHGRSSLPYSFRNSPSEETAVYDGKREKLLQDSPRNGEENEIDNRPAFVAKGGKHKHHISNEVRPIQIRLLSHR